MSKILVLNAGSSSIKYQLFNILPLSRSCDSSSFEVEAKGFISDLGGTQCAISHIINKKKVTKKKRIDSIESGIEAVFHFLYQHNLLSKDTLAGVGHRVVHGGSQFTTPVFINEEIIKKIDSLSYLAPLHNPANLVGIKHCKKILPTIPQIAVFDTAFHQTMPEIAYRYAIPNRFYTENNVRVYGFHGTSHKYISQKAIQHLSKKKLPYKKLITLHLGNGCSMSAIKNGKCIDTSMGLSPLSGLMMGTRSGDIDPSIFSFLQRQNNIDIDDINTLLNKKSGLLGIAGEMDMRLLEEKAQKKDSLALLALNMFIYKIKKFIGAYFSVLNGIDALIFTAGIGENSTFIREKVCQNSSALGIQCDGVLNNRTLTNKVNDISKKESSTKVLVIPTNEELAIAKETLALITLA